MQTNGRTFLRAFTHFQQPRVVASEMFDGDLDVFFFPGHPLRDAFGRTARAVARRRMQAVVARRVTNCIVEACIPVVGPIAPMLACRVGLALPFFTAVVLDAADQTRPDIGTGTHTGSGGRDGQERCEEDIGEHTHHLGRESCVSPPFCFC